jgi:hypothetical protein
MASEVESILVEIREHVRAEEEAKHVARGELALSETEVATNGRATNDPETLSRISAHLTTTARAWDRLPPVVSNRTGRVARIELWIKRRLKKLSRWFTWEQVNFNSAVHQALIDAERTMSAQAEALAGLRAALAKESENVRAQLSQKDREIQTLRAAIDERVRTSTQETYSAIDRRLAELASELRERDEQLSAEQRVCFKQLSLEVSEAAVLEDRGRRSIESRLEKLESK